MKKAICISVFFAAVIALTSCSTTKYSVNSNEMSRAEMESESLLTVEKTSTKEEIDYNKRLEGARIVSHDGKMSENFWIRDLGDLESKSDCVIIGTVIEKEQLRDEDPVLVEMGIQEGTTKSTIRVERVYSGVDIKEGDSIEIEELCYMYDDNSGDTILSSLGPYYPAKKDNTYIFFLSRIEGGHALYTPTSRWYGKYPYNDEMFTKVKENEEFDYTELEYSKPVSIDQSLVKDIYMKYGK